MMCLTTPCAVVQDKGLVDQTRGILTWVTENCPDNFHQEVGYATVSSHLFWALQLLCTLLLQHPGSCRFCRHLLR